MRDRRLSCDLVFALGKRTDMTKTKPSSDYPHPISQHTHTHKSPLKYILSLPLSSEGEIFAGSAWFENNVRSSSLSRPRVETNKTVVPSPETHVYVCVCDLLKVFHNNQKCNQRWNGKQRQRQRERGCVSIHSIVFEQAEVHFWLPGWIGVVAVTAALQDADPSRCIFKQYKWWQ